MYNAVSKQTSWLINLAGDYAHILISTESIQQTVTLVPSIELNGVAKSLCCARPVIMQSKVLLYAPAVCLAVIDKGEVSVELSGLPKVAWGEGGCTGYLPLL